MVMEAPSLCRGWNFGQDSEEYSIQARLPFGCTERLASLFIMQDGIIVYHAGADPN